MRIVRKYGDIIHWTKGFGWMVYDGHWILHETGTSNDYQFATSALLDIKKEVARIPATWEQNEAKPIKTEILNHAKRSESTALREQALAQVKHHATIAISENAFDKNPWLLNVSNGTLNLKMFEFYSHRREDLLTKIANVEYDKNAQCPLWNNFIALIMDGNEKLTRFLQKAVGYSLTGSVQEKCFFICSGASGENGKSTFVNAINDMLGKYAKPTRIQTFLEKNNESSNDIAALAGARFVSSIEVKETRRFDEALVKQLTGGGPVSGRFLFKEFCEYYPHFTIWFAVNNKLHFDATDSALVNRLRVIPFNVNLAAKLGIKTLDRNFGEKLRAEFPGILNWALEGLKLWQEEGLGTCEEVVAAVEEYKLENDNVTPFLEDNCVKGPYSISKTDLYNAYVSACNQAQTKPVLKNTFGNQVTKFGVKEGRTSKARLWEGITTQDHLSRVEKEMAAAEQNFKLLQESFSAKRDSKH